MLVIPAGCQTISAQSQTVAALLDKPSVNCRQQLEQALRTLTGGNVTLAQDAFTNAPTLILERAQIMDLNGVVRDGMLLEKPPGFRLWLSGAGCVLENQQTGEQEKLVGCNCRPAK
ncbi:MAG TPA: hypothetical protein VGJ93_03080 [Desulfuromonadaceae bacterium]|jgi:hypothetical protein